MTNSVEYTNCLAFGPLMTDYKLLGYYRIWRQTNPERDIENIIRHMRRIDDQESANEYPQPPIVVTMKEEVT